MKRNSDNYTLLPQGQRDSLDLHIKKRRWQWIVLYILVITLGAALIISRATNKVDDHSLYNSSKPACPQYPALKNSGKNGKLEKDIQEVLSSGDFLKKSVNRMQGAVQIPTEVFDGMETVGEDQRWDIFKDFHTYLGQTFPLVFTKLKVTNPNTYGILIEWKGKDESLKPYLFTAHQDVVPVPAVTVPRWKYPPYSAHYDGRFIWGRGATDCKNNLIGVLETLETLLENHFEPERTILAGFGFDEEISGFHGAAYIAKELEEALGRDSIELIIDEGGLGLKEMYGTVFALPGVGEKGYYDIKITVETEGGHSSIPPDNTGIGILSRVVAAIEDTPYSPGLTPVNPYFTTMQCAAEYGTELSSWLRRTIKKSLTSKSAAEMVANHLANDDIRQRYLMQTSQAADLVSGGVKINALPENVYAVVNHRVAVESHSTEVRSKMKSVIESKILPKFSLSLNAWGSISGNTSSTSFGQIILEDFEEPLEPSPVSPYDSDAYKMFTGTIKQVFGKDIIVAPSLMTANTDTKFYWDLSKNIYRFTPVRDEGRGNGHTIDEFIGMTEHIEGVKFFTQLILNSYRS